MMGCFVIIYAHSRLQNHSLSHSYLNLLQRLVIIGNNPQKLQMIYVSITKKDQLKNINIIKKSWLIKFYSVIVQRLLNQINH